MGKNYQQLVIVLAAAFFAFIVWYLASQVRFSHSSVERRMRRMLVEEEVSVFDKWGEKYLKRLKLLSLGHMLGWAQRGGKFTKWIASGLLMRCFALGAGGYVLFIQNLGFSTFTLVATAGAALYPFLRVQGEAVSVRKQVSRMLPEVATLIAVEMQAGSSMDTALSRVAEMPTTIGQLFREALAEQSRSNRPLWSSGTVVGVFPEYMYKQAASGMPQLRRFASQLDRISSKGVDGPKVIAKVAEGFSREYKAAISKAAASLDTKLVFPIMVFYFMPFLLAIGLPLFISVISAF